MSNTMDYYVLKSYAYHGPWMSVEDSHFSHVKSI